MLQSAQGLPELLSGVSFIRDWPNLEVVPDKMQPCCGVQTEKDSDHHIKNSDGVVLGKMQPCCRVQTEKDSDHHIKNSDGTLSRMRSLSLSQSPPSMKSKLDQTS
jgi:hypothetical protein